MQTVYIKGLPGAGKTFVIDTIHNIVKTITGSNTADLVSAPLGCVATLVNRSTHCRCMSIPVGKKAIKGTANVKTTNSNRLKHLRESTSRLNCRLMDKHSMMGRIDWAWAMHRNEELCRPTPAVVDEEFNEVPSNATILNEDNNNANNTGNESTTLDEEAHQHPWGGVPFVYS